MNKNTSKSKSQFSNRIIATGYWLIVISFSILEPWGSIDTRDFSYLGPYKFWEYNAIIVFLLVSMLVLSIFLWQGNDSRKMLIWVTAINSLFILLNLFDLLHFFPDPAQPMPFLVMIIEIIGSLLAFTILIVKYYEIN